MGANDQPNPESQSEREDHIGQEHAKARPVLFLNPRQDEEFVDAAETLLDHHSLAPAAFQDSLRQRYPNAVVRPRQLSGEAIVVWYVFREGHWNKGGPNSEG